VIPCLPDCLLQLILSDRFNIQIFVSLSLRGKIVPLWQNKKARIASGFHKTGSGFQGVIWAERF